MTKIQYILYKVENYVYCNSEIDHTRKMCGHKHKDEADPEIPASNYSQFFKSDVQPLYNTLEGIFNLNEESASFVVNRIFQVL